MLPRIALTAFVAGTLLTTLMPVAGLAANRGSGGRGNSGHAQSIRGGNRGVAPRGGEIRRSEGRSFVSPATGYSRGYIAPRSYGRPVYHGYYGSGVYLGVGAPYGYAYGPGYYDPGYAYAPAYSYGPTPAAQACVPGSYDQNGNWIPNPNCSNPQQQYAPPQQNYDYNQQQYPEQYPQQPQQNYNYDQQQYQQQPSYDPNQRQGYSR